jgi:uncharacterized protein YecT (DUF1311 family)
MSILLTALLAASSTASAPSFECSRAASAAEWTICADPRLAEADRLLAIVYAKAGRKAGLRREQLAWIAQRDRCANAACIAASYESRTIELMDRVDMPLHYERRDQANSPASLDMAPLGDGRHLFRLTALYVYPGGMNADDSLVGGMVRIAGDRGVWRDSEGCSLTFIRNGRGWTVEQGETCHNGLNVTMGGHYRRESRA